MNRRFRLAALERLRASAVQESTRALGAARRALEDAQARQARLQEQLAACAAPARCAPQDALALAERRAWLREQLLLGAGQIEEAGAGVTAAVAGWRSARADLEAVEALHERHRHALAADDARREQRALDDLVTSGAAVARARTGGALA